MDTNENSGRIGPADGIIYYDSSVYGTCAVGTRMRGLSVPPGADRRLVLTPRLGLVGVGLASCS